VHGVSAIKAKNNDVFFSVGRLVPMFTSVPLNYSPSAINKCTLLKLTFSFINKQWPYLCTNFLVRLTVQHTSHKVTTGLTHCGQYCVYSTVTSIDQWQLIFCIFSNFCPSDFEFFAGRPLQEELIRPIGWLFDSTTTTTTKITRAAQSNGDCKAGIRDIISGTVTIRACERGVQQEHCSGARD